MLRYRAIPKMWRWGLAFARNCEHGRFMRHTRTNMALSLLTLELIQRIRAETGIVYDHIETGSMKIYTSRNAMAQVEADCKALEPYVLGYEAVDVARCVALVLALEPRSPTPWRARSTSRLTRPATATSSPLRSPPTAPKSASPSNGA